MRIGVLALLIALAGCAGMPTPGGQASDGGRLQGAAEMVRDAELRDYSRSAEDLTCSIFDYDTCKKARLFDRALRGLDRAAGRFEGEDD